ncbi:MAG: class I SAM-dependent methyltransferase [Planctomycetota bacterium]
MPDARTHRLYHDLAHLWPRLSPPSDYVDEAENVLDRLDAWFGSDAGPLRLLDLGAGGGHLACHLRQARHQVTAVDLSPEMLAQCRSLVPDAVTIEGDMRSIDLGAHPHGLPPFDAVLLTDAVDYMTTPSDASAAVATVARHLRPGGLAMIAPTYVRETFVSGSAESDGEHDTDDPTSPHLFSYVYDLAPDDPDNHRCEMLLLILVRDPNTGRVEVIEDRHECGLFRDAEWRGWIEQAGLELVDNDDPRRLGEATLDDGQPWSLFVATKPA